MATSDDSPALRLSYELLRDIYLNRKTGALELQTHDGGERWIFVSGDLYIPSDHPLRELAEMWALVKARESAPEDSGVDTSLDRDGSIKTGLDWTTSPGKDKTRLKDILVDRFFEAAEQESRFIESTAQVTVDLVGPIPTSQILMDCAVRDRDEFQLLRQLGGEEQRYRALPGSQSAERMPQLDPHEGFLLSRLEQPESVRELLQQTDLERDYSLTKLCRLQAVDLIRREDEAPVRQDRDFLSQEIGRKLAARIEESLAREPLTMDTQAHRELLSYLLSHLGERNYFELLGLQLGASPEDIHDAFLKLGRIVHPCHSEHLGLVGKEAGLEMLFEKATEAYLTLSDPDRSREYFEELGPVISPVKVEMDADSRREEEADAARHNYNVAKGLVWQLQIHSAIQLLEQAVKTDPQPEYFALLGECQAQNPNWLEKAIQSYHHAARLKPDDPELQCILGGLLEKSGREAHARRCYETALKLLPNMPEAEEGLARIGPAIEDLPEKAVGVFRKFFSRRNK